jgi:hypothetical protein
MEFAKTAKTTYKNIRILRGPGNAGLRHTVVLFCYLREKIEKDIRSTDVNTVLSVISVLIRSKRPCEEFRQYSDQVLKIKINVPAVFGDSLGEL